MQRFGNTHKRLDAAVIAVDGAKPAAAE